MPDLAPGAGAWIFFVETEKYWKKIAEKSRNAGANGAGSEGTNLLMG